MSTPTSIGFIHEALSLMEEYFKRKESSRELERITINKKSSYVAFLSIGNPSVRARVFTESAKNIEQLFQKFEKKAMQLARKNYSTEWLKIDFVKDVQSISLTELENLIAKTRRNFFRYGISFDPEFRISLLEQELNGNAILRSVNNGPIKIHEKNLNNYFNYKYWLQRFPLIVEQYRNKTILLFKTEADFIAKDELQIFELYSGEYSNGIRKITDIATETMKLIEKTTQYLTNQVHEDGKFTYGYFSAFGRNINTYNILRHSSTLYSMVEGYELIRDEKVIQAVKRGIEYVMRKAVKYRDEDTAFVVDEANYNEIKLGANATVILAITKYTEVTGDDRFINLA